MLPIRGLHNRETLNHNTSPSFIYIVLSRMFVQDGVTKRVIKQKYDCFTPIHKHGAVYIATPPVSIDTSSRGCFDKLQSIPHTGSPHILYILVVL